MTLIAGSFLAGSLLSLLLPTAMLVALVVWYVKFIGKVPETEKAGKTAEAANPGPAAAPSSAPYPGVAGGPSSAPNPGPPGTPGGMAPPGTSQPPGPQ